MHWGRAFKYMGEDSQPNWFAVYTKPRQERIALDNLERQSFECFLPLADNPYQRRRNRQGSAEPLFSRYLFLRARPAVHSLAAVRSTRGVVSLVRAGFELVRVPASLIAALRAKQEAGNGLVRLEPAELSPGDRVRIFDGPLAGLEGVFRAPCGVTRALLMLNLLGRETTLEVDSLLLQRA